MNVGLFPGQGSLRPGMGTPWVDHPSAVVLDRVAQATEVDVVRLLTVAPFDELVRTDNAQLATYALSSTIAHAIAHRDIEFGLAIGHSPVSYTHLTLPTNREV